MLKKLKVNHAGSNLSFNGPVSGRKYFFDPSKGDLTLLVDEVDVTSLLKMQKTVRDCNCGGQAHNPQIAQAETKVNIFELA